MVAFICSKKALRGIVPRILMAIIVCVALILPFVSSVHLIDFASGEVRVELRLGSINLLRTHYYSAYGLLASELEMQKTDRSWSVYKVKSAFMHSSPKYTANDVKAFMDDLAIVLIDMNVDEKNKRHAMSIARSISARTGRDAVGVIKIHDRKITVFSNDGRQEWVWPPDGTDNSTEIPLSPSGGS